MTEWISGVNIPSCQLMIGMGVPLYRIPDIRRLFGKDPKGTSPIDFDAEPQVPPSGAALSFHFCPCEMKSQNLAGTQHVTSTQGLGWQLLPC